jgi:hypothetical protein
MIQHIVWWALVLGVVMGIIGIYYMDPSMTTVIKYPSPEMVDKLVYKDKNGVCYKYTTKEVDCDANESRMKSFPLA